MNHSLTPGQTAVLRAFHEFGDPMDDLALTVYVHHIEEFPISSSGVRTRRAELVRKGLIAAVDTKQLKSGRRAAIHALTSDGRALVGSLFAASAALA